MYIRNGFFFYFRFSFQLLRYDLRISNGPCVSHMSATLDKDTVLCKCSSYIRPIVGQYNSFTVKIRLSERTIYRVDGLTPKKRWSSRLKACEIF